MSTARKTLVTGAGRGLGRAIALELGRRGHFVAVHYGKSEAEAEAVATEITAHGGQAVLVQGDLSSMDGAKNVAAQAVEKLGGLEVLVNNAGITRDGLALRMSDDAWQAVIGTDLSAPFALIRAGLKHMLAAKYGRIVNIASVVAIKGNPGQANYVAAKAGLMGLTRGIAQEYGGKGITCNAVAPGFIRSDMTENLPENIKAQYMGDIPAGYFGEPEDVAAVVAFLASEGARYVNGQTISVDGGMYPH
jgi:3-oxoacyl-[acyl-carrier protein] reductase